MVARTLIALIVLAAWTAAAAAQTRTLPQTQTTPRLQAAPKLKAVPVLPGQTAGRRVVRGLDFAAQGLGTPGTVRPESMIVRKVEPTHSVLVFYGTINMGNIDYFSVSPGFQTQYQMFADRPQGCQIDVVRLDQVREAEHNYGYKLIYRFWDTATKKQCGDYFRNLKTVTLDLKDLQVKYVSVWQRAQPYPVANPGPRIVSLPPVEARDSSGEE